MRVRRRHKTAHDTMCGPSRGEHITPGDVPQGGQCRTPRTNDVETSRAAAPAGAITARVASGRAAVMQQEAGAQGSEPIASTADGCRRRMRATSLGHHRRPRECTHLVWKCRKGKCGGSFARRPRRLSAMFAGADGAATDPLILFEHPPPFIAMAGRYHLKSRRSLSVPRSEVGRPAGRHCRVGPPWYVSSAAEHRVHVLI